jgi:Ribonuclease G/E
MSERSETKELYRELDARSENLITRIQNLRAKSDRLERECEALRRDAERYRWLRDSGKYAPSSLSGGGWAMTTGYWPEARSDEHRKKLDQAIDKAIGETKG